MGLINVGNLETFALGMPAIASFASRKLGRQEYNADEIAIQDCKINVRIGEECDSSRSMSHVG